MKKRHVFLTLLAAALVLLLAACSDGILPWVTVPPETTPPAGDDGAYNAPLGDLEINQALSYRRDADGTLTLMDSFVADRNTTVFVNLNTSLAPDLEGGSQTLTVTRDGEEVFTLLPHESSTAMRIAFHIDGEHAAQLTPGDYTFTVTLEASTASREVSLLETQPLRILLIPIQGNFHGEVSQPAEGWENSTDHLLSCFPISNSSLEVTVSDVMDLSSEQLDLTTAAGLQSVWLALQQFRGSLGSYDAVFGFVDSPMGVTRNIDCYAPTADIALLSTTSSALSALVTHQVAQILGAGDEYEGGIFRMEVNDPPYGFTGTDADGDEVRATDQTVENARDFGLFSDGAYIYPEQNAYDSYTIQAKNGAVSLMGSAGDERSETHWITAQLWDYLYEKFTQPEDPISHTEDTALIRGILYRPGEYTPQSCYDDALVAGDALPGLSETDEDALAEFTPGQAEAGGSPYYFVFTAQNGSVLDVVPYTPEFYSESDPPELLEMAYVKCIVTVPVGSTAVSLYGPVYPTVTDQTNADLGVEGQSSADYDAEPTTELLWEQAISSYAPEASITNMNSNLYTGVITPAWTGSDADGDSLVYELYFLDDKGEPFRVYGGSGTDCSIDLSQFSVCQEARMILRCTDGFRSVFYLTDTFSTDPALAEGAAVSSTDLSA